MSRVKTGGEMNRIIKTSFALVCNVLALCAQSPGGVPRPGAWFMTMPVKAGEVNGQYHWASPIRNIWC